MKNEQIFTEIQKSMSQFPEVSDGKMMSAKGITYKKKVFAFYINDSMCFKFGLGYDPSLLGIDDWEWLNPFKHKGPMKGWFIVSDKYSDKWFDFAKVAMSKMKEQIDK